MFPLPALGSSQHPCFSLSTRASRVATTCRHAVSYRPHPSGHNPSGPTHRAKARRYVLSVSRCFSELWSAPQVVRPLLLKWLAALCVLDRAAAAESSPPVLTLNVTYYDFRVHEDGHFNPVSHPDFERSCRPGPHSFDPCVGEKGLVEATLGVDGRRRAWHRACGTVHNMTSRTAWYRDTCLHRAMHRARRPTDTRDFGPQARLHSWRLALHAKLHQV